MKVFTLTDLEIERIEAWKLLQKKATNRNVHIKYSFQPSGIGTIVIVENTATGGTLDVTDYSSW